VKLPEPIQRAASATTSPPAPSGRAAGAAPSSDPVSRQAAKRLGVGPARPLASARCGASIPVATTIAVNFAFNIALHSKDRQTRCRACAAYGYGLPFVRLIVLRILKVVRSEDRQSNAKALGLYEPSA